MPIFNYDTKDAVPEDVREHAMEIKEGENAGKWAVNLVSRKALETFRDNNTVVAKERDALKSEISKFHGLFGHKEGDFDWTKTEKDLGDLRTTQQGVNDGKLKKSEDIEGEVAKRTTSMREGYDKTQAENATKLAALEQQLVQANKAYDMTFIDREVARAVTDEKLGVHPTAIQDLTQRAYEVFTVLQDKTLEPRDKNGVIIYGKLGNVPMTVSEWMDEEARKKWPHYFKASKGGGAVGGDGTPGNHGMSQEAWDKLSPREQLNRINAESMKKAGYGR